MTHTRFRVSVISFALLVLMNGGLYGQDYPNKNIRIVTAAAGSGSDFDARIVGQGISAPFAQPVIIDNRANGFIAMEVVSKSPPDGYTLLITGSIFWITPLLQKVNYDPADFAPVSLIERTVLVVAVHPSIPANSIKDLIALAKAKPGQLNYSSAATGGAGHLAGELFKFLSSTNIVRVPYKNSALALAAVLAGEVQLTITDAGLVTPQAKAGKLKALAVTSSDPSLLAPGLPTVSAAGLPGYEMQSMTGIWSPARTPGAIVTKLNQEIVRVLNRPEIRERFLDAGVETIGNSPDQFAAIIKSDTSKIAKLIKDVGIKAD